MTKNRNFRYILDPTSKKFYCPKCGKKRFVRYIDLVTGAYLSEEFGRCDREDHCQYWQKPNGEKCVNATVDYFSAEPVEYSLHPIYWVERTQPIPHTFSVWLEHLWGDAAKHYLKEYRVGGTNAQDTIFWQITASNEVRAGKVIKYNSEGHRSRTTAPNWVHNIKNLQDFNLGQCLFGEHLINGENRKIGIVEAEKTALVLSCEIPSHRWLATGGSGGLKLEKLLPLKGRVVEVFPDEGKYDEWKKKVDEIRNKLPKHYFKAIFVNSNLERIAEKHPIIRGTGCDLADVFAYNRSKLVFPTDTFVEWLSDPAHDPRKNYGLPF